jgi:pyruvate kinase
MRRTKIIATVGPSTDKTGMIEQLIKNGVDIFRINYSHQDHPDHSRRATEIREVSKKLGTEVAIMVDLQGPKIRTQRFKNEKVILTEGDPFCLDTTLGTDDGDQEKVGVTYKGLTNDVDSENILLIDDGRIVLEVTEVIDSRIKCIVKVGGELSNNKGINLLGGGLSAGALTDKDRIDLKHGVEIGADYFAVSFVRNADEVLETKRLITEAGGHADVIAKLERVEAIEHDNAAAIIEASNAIMIARGDLGVEIGDAALPPVQKRLISMAREMDTAVITATQMMESMIDHQIPLRAEVFDVANAVMDGTDAVMLSAETSVGMYPDKVVEAMARICEETEKQRVTRVSDHRINQSFEEIDEAIAMSTMYAANHIGATAIASQTETGSTPLWMSRISSGIPIFAFTGNVNTMRKIRLFRGVYPMFFDITHTDPLKANREIIRHLLTSAYVEKQDLVIITKGDLQGETGGTNNMKIVRVGESLEKFY